MRACSGVRGGAQGGGFSVLTDTPQSEQEKLGAGTRERHIISAASLDPKTKNVSFTKFLSKLPSSQKGTKSFLPRVEQSVRK